MVMTWLPEKLENICSSGKSANCGVSFSRSAFIDELGNHLGIYQMPKLRRSPASDPLPQSISNGWLQCSGGRF